MNASWEIVSYESPSIKTCDWILTTKQEDNSFPYSRCRRWKRSVQQIHSFIHSLNKHIVLRMVVECTDAKGISQSPSSLRESLFISSHSLIKALKSFISYNGAEGSTSVFSQSIKICWTFAMFQVLCVTHRSTNFFYHSCLLASKSIYKIHTRTYMLLDAWLPWGSLAATGVHSLSPLT